MEIVAIGAYVGSCASIGSCKNGILIRTFEAATDWC